MSAPAPAFDYRAARDAVFSSGLPGPLRLLALALIEYMPHCRPSIATLAERCGVERKTVMRGLQRLEVLGVLLVERAHGQRSLYSLQPVPLWRTGPKLSPVPERDGTGTNEGMGPVPSTTKSGPTVGPEAGRSRSGKRESGGAPALVQVPGLQLVGVARTVTMPGPEPTQSYLDDCVMAGVSREQARSTWSHYFGQGLPPGGVERLEWWLVQRAKERSNQLAKVPAKAGAGFRSPEAPIPEPKLKHRNFAEHYGLDLEGAVRRVLATKVHVNGGEVSFHRKLEQDLAKQRARLKGAEA